MRRLGITRELWRRSVEIARDYNFQFMAAEASTECVPISGNLRLSASYACFLLTVLQDRSFGVIEARL
jgi:hypothetical protein